MSEYLKKGEAFITPRIIAETDWLAGRITAEELEKTLKRLDDAEYFHLMLRPDNAN